MGEAPPHPEPPADLATRPLPSVIVPPGSSWFRLYECRFPSSLYFSRGPRHRFNAPAGEYGILYVGDSLDCAFIETFGDSRGPGGYLEIAEDDLNRRCLARVAITRPLRVVDLTDPDLARLGADARPVAGSNYEQARRWAVALWSHPDRPDGLLYISRHDPSLRSLALFDRGAGAVGEERLGSLSHPVHEAALNELLDRYNVALL